MFIFTDDITVGILIGFLITFIIIPIFIAISSLIKNRKRLKIEREIYLNDNFQTYSESSLTCSTSSSVFTIPSGKRCALSALQDGLNITAFTKPEITYLLKYTQLLKFYFEEGNNTELGQATQGNLPDYIYVEYLGDDGLIYQFRFIQTKKIKSIINWHLSRKISLS
ncbi:MAG: hypothetical protein GYA50_06765 [Eubacteriaceae bacterium]|nr:hypothetical protein [Eubacteriaceae bacterium]